MLFKRAIAILEKTAGLDSPEIASALNNLAALYQRADRLADAEPLFKRALAIREKSPGSGQTDLGQSLNNMATLYEKLGRHNDSEPLFKRALAIYEKAAGPDHPAVATLLNNLFGRSKEPFWQQAYTDLLKFVILLRRISDGYMTFSEVYRYILDSQQIDRGMRRRELPGRAGALQGRMDHPGAAQPDPR